MEGSMVMNILGLLGGLGFFLFGMKLMSEGLERAAGTGLQKLLNSLTSNRIVGVLVGVGVTAVIQSSSATTVMVVGFVNVGLLTLKQAIGVIMGANVGTTVTSLMLSVQLNYAAIFAVIGLILSFFQKKDKLVSMAQIFMGLAILFMGMETMSSSMEPLKNWEGFQTLMIGAKNPLVGVLIGAGITALMQSSSASIGILQVLASQGLVTLDAALFILFGQNIGTCITAMIASSGTTPTAKRAAVVHLLFNVIGTLVFMAAVLILQQVGVSFTGFIQSLVPGTSTENLRLQIALCHVFFNVGTTLLLLPFSGLLEKAAWFFVRGADIKREALALQYFDSRLLSTPAVAVSQLFREVQRMAGLANRNFHAAVKYFFEKDDEAVHQIDDTEKVLDYLNQEITDNLVEIRALELSDSDVQLTGSLFHVVNDLERIGDHSMNIMEIAHQRAQEKIKFSKKAEQEIQDLFSRVSTMLDQALDIFDKQHDDTDRLLAIEMQEQTIDDLSEALRNHHVDRLKERKCTAKNGMLYLDLISNLERIADHADNIANSVNHSK